MNRIQRILCPTSLSAESDAALLYALGLARAYDAKLTVCYAAAKNELLGEGPNGAALTYAVANGRVRELFEGSLLKYLPPITFLNLDWQAVVVDEEDVGEAITRTAAEEGVDLIVMRSRRRPHRAALLGSTAEAVCRKAPCPVLVTHPDEREWIEEKTGKIRLERLLVAYDFSDYSELALNYALSLAQEHQAELHLLHVLPEGSVQEPELTWYPLGKDTAYHQAARRLQRAVPEETYLWCDIKHTVVEGQPYREILNYADKHNIDLISLGAHGAGFGLRTLFGSNVDRVLRQAPCPVLVARPLKPATLKESDIKLARASQGTASAGR
jgi:nucleotide-binding universal stress UspA family protein